MIKSEKTGFSIAELILTTVILAVVMVIAPTIAVKRNVKPKKIVEEHQHLFKCTQNCIYYAEGAILTKSNGKQEELYDYIRHSNKMYKITLRGGGGGATDTSCGYNSEEKILYLYSLYKNDESSNDNDLKGILTGYYLLQIGKGGLKGKEGKPTILCAITSQLAKRNPNAISCSSPGAVILAKAAGGIYSNETENKCDTGISRDGADEDTAGNGGKIEENEGKGNNGEIIIGDESK